MAKADTPAARAPRGTKVISQAFFHALEQIPELSRGAVEKAAIAMIRDEIKLRREKLKAATAREKARKLPAPAKSKSATKPRATQASTASSKGNGTDQAAPLTKKRPRKPADAPTV